MISTFDPRVPEVTVLGPVTKAQEEILTPQVINFVVRLHKAFNPTRKRLLQARKDREAGIRNGEVPDFLPETKAIRENPTWKGAPPAPGLVDRRVEITGPVDRKMVINALKAGSPTFMADFEDSTAPTWENILNGQINLRDAVNRNINYTAPNGKVYSIGPNDKVATLIVRPRGWHMEEKHFLINNEPVSASLFDFALYFYHNAKNSLNIGAGPYFYLPKMESHLEARLWNDVFNLSQDTIGLPRGTIRATVLIETILAVFEMEEIIYELREHSSGLNCGRWDYIFSFIKKFRHDPKFVLPDRSDITMLTPFMHSYVQLLIQTCHRRGVHAMGGMAAQIPIKNDEKANNAALTKVRKDKLNEVKNGHDGTWVAHPALIPVAKEIFDQYMQSPNQMYITREDVKVSASQLIDSRVDGKITEQGVRSNISVSLTYIEAWLRGSGCVPIHNLMEDAATAEISRSQLWQWAHHRSVTADGKTITPEYLNKVLDEEITKLQQSLGTRFDSTKYLRAKEILARQMIGEEYSDFITTLLYDEITTFSSKSNI